MSALRALGEIDTDALWTTNSKAFEQQADMDIMYIRSRSLWQDIRILIQTPFAMITAKGAY
ncbi:MAG: lipopolysaccharide/colanic/teichoic acid biosynthesis glycosyltransferase [Candidatus Azotimanducaceae bacterium]|jgi:lipopolysaccharide/colanic/teichoic acid biosynthesis glycosyltransferase